MKKFKSYLEFGKILGKKKVIYDSRDGQEAYDFFMVSRYLKDMIAYRTGNIKNIHHKEDLHDNIKKYTALSICKNPSNPLIYYEVGSSLMGVADALEFLNKKFKKLNIEDILFVGVDNSDMMNSVAKYTHSGYKLDLYTEVKVLTCNIFFAKGVSLLYTFNDEKFFSHVLKNSDIAIFDYTFSLKDAIKDFVGTGKPVTFLSLEKCKDLLNDNNKKLILNPSKRVDTANKNKATYECVYGDKSLLKAYFRELGKKFALSVDIK